MLRIVSRNLTRHYYAQRSYAGLCNQQININFSSENVKNKSLLESPHKWRQLQRYASTGGAEEISFLATVWQKVSMSTPVAYMHDILLDIHDVTGLPWWASIIFTTVLFRSLITLPLTIYQQKITARIERITLEMPAIVAQLKKEAAMAMKKYNWTEKQTKIVYLQSLRKQWNNLVVRDNCHPFKTFIVMWVQIPLWIFQSMALRNIIHMQPNPLDLDAQVAFTEMCIGGFGWIPNLTEVDSSYILPVTLGLLNLSIIEIQSMLRTRPNSRLQTYATNAFRVLSLAMVPIACTVPSALCLYWVASSSFGLVQNLILVSPTVRRTVGIPLTKSEIPSPYEHLWTTILIRSGQLQPKVNTAADVQTKDKSEKSKTT